MVKLIAHSSLVTNCIRGVMVETLQSKQNVQDQEMCFQKL